MYFIIIIIIIIIFFNCLNQNHLIKNYIIIKFNHNQQFH